MRQHSRDDVGIVDLTASEGIMAAQLHEPIPHQRAVLEDGDRRTNASASVVAWESDRLSPGLRPRHDDDILAKYLSADRERLAGGQPGESGPGRLRNGALWAVA
jgi:hypothetical protein